MAHKNPLTGTSNMISADELQEARDAVDQLATAFEILENITKQFDNDDRRRFFNPETFGPISAFLGRGAGYEAASRSSEFHDSDDFLATVEDYTEFDEDDLTEDEDEENRRDEKNGLYPQYEDYSN